MKKQTIASLTRKGYSQAKIARTLKIRKMKVVTYQKTHKIGKRVASPFWENVKTIREMKGISHAKAIKEVKYSKKWFTKRQARLTGVEKAKDEMRQKWNKIMSGEIERDFFQQAEGEELMEAAEYD